MTQGLLVHGANHFIVNGPEPGDDDARELVRYWEVPRIGHPAGTPWKAWSLCTRALRENLTWAVVLESADANSPAVEQLLAGIATRGVRIRRAPGLWSA
jgi:hypothetical protein